MRVRYDPEADAAYIYLREIEPGGVDDTYMADPEVATDMINLDFDRDGRLIGIEVLSASRQLPPELIARRSRLVRRHNSTLAQARVPAPGDVPASRLVDPLPDDPDRLRSAPEARRPGRAAGRCFLARGRGRYTSPVQKLTINAASLRRAREIEAALRGFERDLLADDGRYCVHVTLPERDGGIVAVLNALEAYVRERGDGPVRIEYDGQSYTVEASPPSD
jgi:uncharacterized protein YuzE